MVIIMSNTIIWLWLTIKKGMNPNKISELLKAYGNIGKIYMQTSYDLPCLTKRDQELLMDKSLKDAEETYRKTCDCGGKILTCDSKYYPRRLRTIEPMPYVLYMIGQPMDLDNILGIGVVGTRINTEYGAQMAGEISYGLGKSGAVVISGLALGIDGIAMNEAIKGGGATIGVLGCGIDIIYPKTNTEIFKKVRETGMIISEYPPGAPGYRSNFPLRNRIIAGLSNGVLIVEGSKNSGSMITADYAKKYKRDLFAVPRNSGDKNADGKLMDGTNELLKAGARPVTTAGDILSVYGIAQQSISGYTLSQIPQPKRKSAPKPTPPQILQKPNINILLDKTTNQLQQSIITLINKKPLIVDEIVRALNQNITAVSIELTIMETMGLIKRMPDGRYTVCI